MIEIIFKLCNFNRRHPNVCCLHYKCQFKPHYSSNLTMPIELYLWRASIISIEYNEWKLDEEVDDGGKMDSRNALFKMHCVPSLI